MNSAPAPMVDESESAVLELLVRQGEQLPLTGLLRSVRVRGR